MSVTFSLRVNNSHVDILNSNFNRHEAEDPIYNPRYESDAIYPEINVSNINAFRIIREFELPVSNDLVGLLLNKDVNDFVLRVNKLQSKYESLDRLSLITEEEIYLQRLAKYFDRLGRYALALNDDIVWS
jgi:hypothetical protein